MGEVSYSLELEKLRFFDDEEHSSVGFRAK